MNKMIERLRAEYAKGFTVSGRFYRQLMCDLSVLVLAQDFGWKPDRLYKFCEALSRLHDEYADIWNSDSNDIEYSKARLDDALKAVCGERFLPWEERYK